MSVKPRVPASRALPPYKRVKKQERDFWKKDARKRIANGQAYDRPSISNVDLLRLLQLVDDREEDIRDLTGARE